MPTVLIHASLDFRGTIVESAERLAEAGIDVLVPDLQRYQHIRDVEGRAAEFDRIKNRLSRENCNLLRKAEALYILNPDHRGIQHYVGGNSFFEMSIAFFLGLPIFLSNPVPEDMTYTEEIRSFFPEIVGPAGQAAHRLAAVASKH